MAAAPPLSPSPPLPIAGDLFCIQCRYNLRTRTAGDRCPECGLAVARSLEHYRENAKAIVEPRAIRLAAWVLAVPAFLSVVSFAISAVLLYYADQGGPLWLRWADAVAQSLGHLVFVVMLVVGVPLIVGALGQSLVSATTRSLLMFMTTAYALMSGLSTLGGIGMLLRLNGPAGRRGGPLGPGALGGRGGPAMRFAGAIWALQVQRVGTALICVVLGLAAFVILQRLAKSLALPRLVLLTRAVFAALVAQSSLALVFYSLMRTWRWSRDLFSSAEMLLAMDFLSVVVTFFVGWYWLVLAKAVDGKHASQTVKSPAADDILQPPAASRVSPEEKVKQFLKGRPSEVPPH